jgi:glutaredoxin
MRNLFFLAIIVGGIWYWYKHHPKEVVLDASGNPAVLVYTAKQCTPCKDELSMLDSRGVPYQEKEIDPSSEQDEDAKRLLSMGDNVLPLTLSGSGKVKGYSKWDLIGLLGENFGDQYLTQDEKGYFSQHFDAGGKPNVVLYGTSWCTGCAALRKELQEHNVSFVDIDVEKSGEFDKLTRVMDIPGYPSTWVGYTRVHGVTYSAVKAVMN